MMLRGGTWTGVLASALTNGRFWFYQDFGSAPGTNLTITGNSNGTGGAAFDSTKIVTNSAVATDANGNPVNSAVPGTPSNEVSATNAAGAVTLNANPDVSYGPIRIWYLYTASSGQLPSNMTIAPSFVTNSALQWLDTYFLNQTLNLSDLTSVSTALTNLGFSNITAGAVLLGNGAKVPTSDATRFFWDTTNHRLGIGNAAPAVALDVQQSGTGLANFTNTGALGASNGAILDLFVDSGAATTSGSRFGLLGFGGAFDASHTLSIGAQIAGFATELWSSSAKGSKLVLSTIGNTTTTMNTVLTLDQDKSATFAGAITATALTLSTTPLAIGSGGTGQATKAAAFDALSPMTTSGDIIYGGAAGTNTRLAGNITTTKEYLSQTGSGAASAAPAWAQIAFADLSGQATLAQLPSIGTKTILSNITGGGAVPAANTLTAVLDTISSTQGTILYRDAAAWLSLAPGTNLQFLQTQGAAANPQWASAIASSTVRSGTTTIGSGIRTKAVSFSTNMANTTYSVMANVSNLTDVNPSYFIPICVNKTISGFTMEWNEVTDSANYILDWIAIGAN